ncbi:MAG TPA: ribosome silencing factor [Bacteroidales bacterium]|nr:ribosome silencing factor [Bacteroidales bacterium]HCI54387.1 ribosome silencing factor [Bacteroidales bacterium]HOU96283.1 ribosome silencing factor [Bacteroidales bacterium]HQG36472.1 ribosome silencing factor [Bacteroidales bacterium]HQG52551.1 ribosome silencing factor [Bacteroidales bacterium]
MKEKPAGTDSLINCIVKGIFEKKGQDVVKIDLRNLENRITDYFIICHGNSVTQVDSITSSVEEIVREETGEKPTHIEGLENCFWVLLDYIDVVVHIFQEKYRNFYSLESLWADAEIKKMEDIVKGK